MIPGVAPYAIAYACVKSVSYSLFFWVPYYLTAERHMDNSKANLFSVLYDVGAIIGSVAGGYLTDRMGGKRSLYIVLSLCLAGIDMQFLFGASEHMTGLLLFFTGMLMGGPEMLITTTISADLGTHESLAKNAQALATVTGIIDGTGSIGAALAQYLVGRIANCHSTCDPIAATAAAAGVCPTTCAWDSVFLMLQMCIVVGVVSLSGLVVQETRSWRRRRHDGAPEKPVNKRQHQPVLQTDDTDGNDPIAGPDTPGSTTTLSSSSTATTSSHDTSDALHHRV